ncbi:MAG: alanine racemase C-terminal domain-containing protein, partial [Oscillospiraceae bacterium]
VKTLDSGRDVSYGRAYTTEKPTRIATLTIGYADGYPRALSNKGIVSIHGNKCKVIGKVCMDQMMVDISDIENVHAGDVATIFGDDGADSVENIADKANTIVYEILCGISRRVPRVYISCGREVGAVDYLNN